MEPGLAVLAIEHLFNAIHLDAPEVAVVAALTHIQACAQLEQMIAHATRVDPHADPYATQRALVLQPERPILRPLPLQRGDRAGHAGQARQSTDAIPSARLVARPPRRAGS